MKIRTNVSLRLLFAAQFIALPMAQTPAQAQQPPNSAPGNDFILRAAASEIANVLARHGLTEMGRLDSPPSGQEVYLVRAPGSVSPEQVIAAVTTQEPAVNAVEEVFLASLPETHDNVTLNQAISQILGALGDTNTVLFDQDSTGMDRYVWAGYVEQEADDLVQASQARTVERGDGVVVAVLDTGIDPDHALFDGHLVLGYDFILDQAGDGSEWGVLDESSIAILGESSIAILGSEDVVGINESSIAILGEDQINQLDLDAIPDAFGHGTMVAGIIHLVAPEAKIMPLRVFDGDGYATVFDIVRAINYAVDHGATVIHMSFSIEVLSPELVTAIDYADQSGVTLVASVGNQGLETMVYPAGLCNVFGVASTDVGDYVSSFSNLGNDLVHIAAPGESVITAYPGGGWAGASGTSFAAPWISGTLALLADAKGDGTAGRVGFSQVNDALSWADQAFGPGSGQIGHGRVDIKSAIDHLSVDPPTGSSGCSGSSNLDPRATITAPADGSIFTEGDSVVFTGTGSDVEDGDLTAVLAWTSDLDGAIGSGGLFSTGALSAGTHTITALATDSVLLSDSVSITLTVVHAPQTSGANTAHLIASQDTYLRKDRPDRNYGSRADVRLNADARKVSRPLMWFDLSSIPASTRIASAKLKLYVTKSKDDLTVKLHRVTRAWVEGTCGTGADWNASDDQQAWTNPGGDFAAMVLGSVVADTKYVWVEIDVTALVQAWVDGLLANDGILLDSSGGHGEIRFGARESAGEEPQLDVIY